MNKKVTGMMKEKKGGKIIIKFLVQRSKAYSYLTEDYGKENKAKETKKCVMKRKLRFEHYKRCL